MLAKVYTFLWSLDDDFKSKLKSVGDQLQVWIPALFLAHSACAESNEASKTYIIVFLALMLVVQLTKGIFNNPRPRETEGAENPSLDLDWSPSEGNSFVSGHTAAAFGGAFFYFNITWWAGVIALLLASVVGLSRIVVKAHWLRDVLTSVALAAVAYFVSPIVMTIV